MNSCGLKGGSRCRNKPEWSPRCHLAIRLQVHEQLLLRPASATHVQLHADGHSSAPLCARMRLHLHTLAHLHGRDTDQSPPPRHTYTLTHRETPIRATPPKDNQLFFQTGAPNGCSTTQARRLRCQPGSFVMLCLPSPPPETDYIWQHACTCAIRLCLGTKQKPDSSPQRVPGSHLCKWVAELSHKIWKWCQTIFLAKTITKQFLETCSL